MKLSYVLLLGLFLMSIVIAAPPVQQSVVSTVGINIEVPIQEYIKINETYKFHIHAHNSTSGLLLDNTTTVCVIHIYDGGGNHIIEDNMSFDSNGVDFKYEVLGGNFSTSGMYAILLFCEVPGKIGGFFEYGVDVTTTGGPTPTGVQYFRVFY